MLQRCSHRMPWKASTPASCVTWWKTLGKVDAFSGVTMDLETQTVTLQYKQGSERDALLGSADRRTLTLSATIFSTASAKAQWLPRFGATLSMVPGLLDDVIAAGDGWTKGCYTGQTCALVLGPAASGKTTLLRRFAVEIARKRTRFCAHLRHRHR